MGEGAIDVGVGVDIASLQFIGCVVVARVIKFADAGVGVVAFEIELGARGSTFLGERAIVLANGNELDVDDLLLDEAVEVVDLVDYYLEDLKRRACSDILF
jgi:hypothetical protein